MDVTCQVTLPTIPPLTTIDVRESNSEIRRMGNQPKLQVLIVGPDYLNPARLAAIPEWVTIEERPLEQSP